MSLSPCRYPVILLLALMAGSAGTATAASTPVRTKHCIPFEHGIVGIYAYNGNDASHTTPVSGFDNVPTEAITVLNCDYAYCDVVYQLKYGGNVTKYYVYDTAGDSTLQAAAGADHHFSPNVQSGLQSCVPLS